MTEQELAEAVDLLGQAGATLAVVADATDERLCGGASEKIREQINGIRAFLAKHGGQR